MVGVDLSQVQVAHPGVIVMPISRVQRLREIKDEPGLGPNNILGALGYYR